MNPFLATDEVWKPIKNYELLYKVSNLGRIFSISSNKMLSVRTLSSGYPCFSICKKGKQITKRVHVAVAESFLGLKKGLVVNHKDGNKLNNCLSNLEVVTQKENNVHAIITGLKGKKSSPVAQYNIEGKLLALFASQKEAEEKTGICRKQINNCIKNKQKSAKGFIWCNK